MPLERTAATTSRSDRAPRFIRARPTVSRQGIAFDYNSPAELYLSRPRRHTDYRRFTTAAEAIHYAVEELSTGRSLSAWMQVGDERFNKNEINRLYDDDDYPLRTPLSSERGSAAELPAISEFRPPPVDLKKALKT